MKSEATIPPDVFDRVVAVLSDRIGEDNGITIDQLAVASGLSRLGVDAAGNAVIVPLRRQMERLIETRIQDIPFVVISSTQTGLFRPASHAELEHWWATLHSRIKACARRLHIGRIKASGDGWSYEGSGRFLRRTQKTDLFLEFNPQVKGQE